MQFGQQWTSLRDQCEWHKHHIKLNNRKQCCFSHCLIVWYFWFCPCCSPLTTSNFSFTSPLPDFPPTFILSHSPPLPSICFHLHPLKILSWPFPPHGSPLSSLSYSNLLAHFTPSTLFYFTLPPPLFFFFFSSSPVISSPDRSPTSSQSVSAAVTAWTLTTQSASSACSVRVERASRSSCLSYTAASAPAAKVGLIECGPVDLHVHVSRQII